MSSSKPYLPVFETEDSSVSPPAAGPARYQPGRIGATPPASAAVNNNITFDTLDEPVIETLKRDLQNIWHKLQVVMLVKTAGPIDNPSGNVNQEGESDVLRDWDLWGPLFLCLLLAISLGVNSVQSVRVFTLIFTIVSLGSLAVTLNARLLSFRLSIFQSLCVLGYGLFPLALVAALKLVISWRPLVWIGTTVAFAWATIAATRFVAEQGEREKKMLAIYPVFLFYGAIAWLILVA